MKKRVYGILGISSIMSNWNADFSGYPKTTSDGRTFGSDKAFKYPMKKMWDDQGKKVVYIKSMELSESKGEVSLIPKTLKSRYEQLFGTLDKKNNIEKVLSNLFQAIDVKNFGATFAEAGMNLSITGAVQIGQGFNLYEDTDPQEQPILSPFRDPLAGKKKAGNDKTEEAEEAKNSTLGTKIVSNEAHYFYPFTVNPFAYREYTELGVTEGYTEKDYQEFKKAALTAATCFATNSKVGCENEFALFVETDLDFYLPNLSEYVKFTKGTEDTKNIIELTCMDLLEEVKEKIQSIQIYYNPYTTQIVPEKKEGVRYYHIITQKEV